MESLKDGEYVGKTTKGYKIYKHKLKSYGIKEMKVVVDKDNVIITAFPLSGSEVKKKK